MSSLFDIGTGDGQQTGTSHGWDMPESFGNSEKEFRAAVTAAAIFDRSFFGRIEVTGTDRLDLLHRLSTNDLIRLRPSQVAGTIFVNDKGRIIDLVFVAVLESSLLLIVSPNNEERLIRWIQKHSVLEDITLRCVTEETAMFSIIGSRALETFSRIGSTSIGANSCVAPRVTDRSLLALGIETSRWQAVHVVGPVSAVSDIRKDLTNRGEGRDLVVMGSLAFEWYRIATGMPAMGKELTESYNPYDIGLTEFVNYRKGCYLGQEVIARLDTYQKAVRALAGLIFEHLSPNTAAGTPLMKEGKEIGWVTSVAPSAFDGYYPGLGVIPSEEISRGDRVQVADGTARVRSLPMFPPYS